MTRDARRGQAGQTLIMFAITMTFMFLALIALVGDSDVLMVRYSQVNSEALFDDVTVDQVLKEILYEVPAPLERAA